MEKVTQNIKETLLKEFHSSEVYEQDGVIVLDPSNYDSNTLTETIMLKNRLANLLENVVGTNVALQTFDKLHHRDQWSDFSHIDICVEDTDYEYYFSGENLAAEVDQHIVAILENSEFDSPDAKEEKIKNWKDAFNENSEKGPHAQWYTNNCPDNLDKVERLYEGSEYRPNWRASYISDTSNDAYGGKTFIVLAVVNQQE